MVLNILVMDWFELWEWWLIVVCRAQIISTFIHFSARVMEFELVFGSRCWISWRRWCNCYRSYSIWWWWSCDVNIAKLFWCWTCSYIDLRTNDDCFCLAYVFLPLKLLFIAHSLILPRWISLLHSLQWERITEVSYLRSHDLYLFLWS